MYIDELITIILPSGDEELSPAYKEIIKETDLIKARRPTYNEGYKATLDAIERLEKVINQPILYYNIFETPNILDSWRNPENHKYLLFKEKYSHSWESFCLDNNFGRKEKEGLLLPSQLAFIFMTILSNAIAESKGLPVITNNTHMDRFSIFIRQTNNSEKHNSTLAKNIIQLHLPNINEIDLNKIIKLRNSTGFKEKLKSFHEKLDQYHYSFEQGLTDGEDFVKSLKFSLQEMTSEMLKLGPTVYSLGLGTWLPIQNTNEELLKYFFETGSLVGGLIKIKSFWHNTRPTRLCRKYLSDLKNLSI